MLQFKKVDGNKINSIVDYTIEVLDTFNVSEVHIGTDSQNHRRGTTYCTVIAFRYGNKGIHIIYSRQEIKPKIRDLWNRLWKETEFSLEVAQELKKGINSEGVNIEIEIDMDFNKEEVHASNKLVQASRGFASSMGFKTNIKPYKQIATKAADNFCR